MIIVTSLSPRHSNAENQVTAIESWKRSGWKCCSMNTPDESAALSQKYDIDIIETSKVLSPILNKPLVNINAMIDLAISLKEDLLIVNSDIILTHLPEFKQDGITILSRYDYINDMAHGVLFQAGFDAFHIPYKLLYLYPPSIYAMGAAWWDYWIPYRAILAGVQVYWPHDRCAFHKIHPTQYQPDEWERMGEYFRWEFQLNKKYLIGQQATNILLKIQSRCKR